MENEASRILFLFSRPREPVYIPKGKSKVVFDISADQLPTCDQPNAQSLFDRFLDGTETKISINKMDYPDMRFAMELGRDEAFTYFSPRHRKIAGELIAVFMSMRSVKDLMSLAGAFRDKLNPELFMYALAAALVHRHDTRNLSIPPLFEIFPGKYFKKATLAKCRREAFLMEEGSRSPVEAPTNLEFTGGPEDQLAYWREDLGISLHHWHWHLVYPGFGDKSVVDKPRRGELFYYMHQQVLARYNCERMCHGVARVRPLTNLRKPVEEAYFPNMDTQLASKVWPARPSGLTLQDVVRPAAGLNLTIDAIEIFRNRVFMAIHTNQALKADNTYIPLDEFNGIDILGNMIESTSITPNSDFYGDFHNSVHSLISFIHDPNNEHNTSFGVMGDSATAMRDPIFYRWHCAVNDMFHEHKVRLPKYPVERLNYPGIQIRQCRISTPGSPANTLSTHWNQSAVDLSKGLDFQPRGDILVQITHLNHVEFTYNVEVINHNNSPLIGTVRIFLGPKNDERGVPLNFRTQKDLMMEMDKFYVRLGRGLNVIHRQSTESGVTIPFDQTFRNLDKDPGGDDSGSSNYCGCGWPQHMLVPRGNLAGYEMVLFVMISNDGPGEGGPVESTPGCQPAASYCGLRDQKYPDLNPMGYPFDRPAREGVGMLSQFLTPNMSIQDIIVRHENVVKPRKTR